MLCPFAAFVKPEVYWYLEFVVRVVRIIVMGRREIEIIIMEKRITGKNARPFLFLFFMGFVLCLVWGRGRANTVRPYERWVCMTHTQGTGCTMHLAAQCYGAIKPMVVADIFLFTYTTTNIISASMFISTIPFVFSITLYS